jgi:hypothetical protein
MTLFAGVIGRAGAATSGVSQHRLMAGTGVAAIVVGCAWIAGAAF